MQTGDMSVPDRENSAIMTPKLDLDCRGIRDRTGVLARNDGNSPSHGRRRRSADCGDETSRMPVFSTPLFGREAEVAELVDLVRSDAPLVTITGQGGIGKTRVALEVARQLNYRLLFLQLADLPAADLGAAVVARGARRAADVDRWAGSGPTRCPVVRRTSRNACCCCWTPSTACTTPTSWSDRPAPSASPNAADPDLVVLVTSRARLGLRFEVVLPLTGLGLQPDGPAVQMFRERSRAVGGDLGEPGADAAITAVCRQLRGVPLAIELAAGAHHAAATGGIAGQNGVGGSGQPARGAGQWTGGRTGPASEHPGGDGVELPTPAHQGAGAAAPAGGLCRLVQSARRGIGVRRRAPRRVRT